jgi:hypothetical protein
LSDFFQRESFTPGPLAGGTPQRAAKKGREKNKGTPSGVPLSKPQSGSGHVGAAFQKSLVAEAHCCPFLALVEAQAVHRFSKTSKSLESL